MNNPDPVEFPVWGVIPRESAPASSSTARRVLSSHISQRLDLSECLTRLRLGSLALGPSLRSQRFAAAGILAPLLLDASRRHAGGLATRMLDTYRGGLLSSR